MKTKILIGILFAALLGSLGLLTKIGYDRIELQSANEQLNKELMKANLDLGRAKTEFGDANKYVGELESAIQDEINQREAIVNSYGKLQAEYRVSKKKARGQTTNTVYVDKTIEVPTNPNLIPGMVYIATSPMVLQPLRYIQGRFKDNKVGIVTMVFFTPDEPRWLFDYEINMRVEVQFAETRLPSGGVNNYATIWEIDQEGNRVGKLGITGFSVVINRPDQKQWFFAPHIDIGGLAGVELFTPDLFLGGSIGFSFFGYGLTVNDLDWRFLRVSLDLSNDIPGPGISPVVYNLGQFIPFISDLWIGPHLTYLPPTELAVGLFVGTML